MRYVTVKMFAIGLNYISTYIIYTESQKKRVTESIFNDILNMNCPITVIFGEDVDVCGRQCYFESEKNLFQF